MSADARQVARPIMPGAALPYAARGWPVLPVASGSKIPLTAHGVKDASTDESMIRTWGTKWPSASVGIATGAASGLAVIDVDPGGKESLAALVAKHQPLPPTLEARTPRSGQHLYFSLAPGQIVRNSAGKLGIGLDVRGEGGFVVAPPSPGYTWMREIEPVPLPEWLAGLVCEPAKPTSGLPPELVGKLREARIPKGQRNDTLTREAGALRHHGATPQAIEAALKADNAARCDPPLPETEVRRIAESIARYEPAERAKRKSSKHELRLEPTSSTNTPAPVQQDVPKAGAAPGCPPALTPEQAHAMLADLLFAIGGFLSSYLAISPAQTHVLAVWVFHTHTIDAVDRTPYLHVSSPEKRSGKTLLLELLWLLVRNPWFTSNATTAALARKIADQKPTVLLDEADTMLSGEGERIETLRGILNAGYARGATFTRCVGEGSRQTPTDFPVFTAKAIAGLRDLPDTIADRSIPIRMKRALPGEIRQRFYRREAESAAVTLKGRIEGCAAALVPALKDARPERVLELNDRQNDITEPLLAIADVARDGWPEYLRGFLRELFQAEEESEQSWGIRLLGDLRGIFDERGVERLASADLVQALRGLSDAPWSDWRGKGITGHALARTLRGFHIRSLRWREGIKVLRGYERKSFEDAWSRYLPSSFRQEGGEASQATESTS